MVVAEDKGRRMIEEQAVVAAVRGHLMAGVGGQDSSAGGMYRYTVQRARQTE